MPYLRRWQDLSVPTPVQVTPQRRPMSMATCGFSAGLNQTACPTLRLAVAFGDTVVELWRSPEHRAEGWHQLVAYPGRIKGQFQVRWGWGVTLGAEAVREAHSAFTSHCSSPSP